MDATIDGKVDKEAVEKAGSISHCFFFEVIKLLELADIHRAATES